MKSCKHCGRDIKGRRANALHCSKRCAKAAKDHRYRVAHPERLKAKELRRVFGMTLEEYDNILQRQNGGCAICGNPCQTGNSLAVDHDHATGKIRGLLCLACNTALGKFRDSPDLLLRAASYLLRQQGELSASPVRH